MTRWAAVAGVFGVLCLIGWLVCVATDHPVLRPWRDVTERGGAPWFKGDVPLAIAAAESLRYAWIEDDDMLDTGNWIIAVRDSTVPDWDDSLVLQVEHPNLDIARRKALGLFWAEPDVRN